MVSVCEAPSVLLDATGTYMGVATFSVIDAGRDSPVFDWKDLECHL